jgi:quinol monooxygenase YgiN
VRADHRQAFIDAGASVVDETRREDGCLEYSLFEDAMAPGRFVFVELWRDQAANGAHVASAHLATFRRPTGKLVTGRHIVVYDVDEGRTV